MIQRLYKYICITTYIQNLIHQIVKEQIGLIKDTLKHTKCALMWLLIILGGARRDRIADPLLAKQVLSQLSYGPI